MLRASKGQSEIDGCVCVRMCVGACVRACVSLNQHEVLKELRLVDPVMEGVKLAQATPLPHVGSTALALFARCIAYTSPSLMHCDGCIVAQLSNDCSAFSTACVCCPNIMFQMRIARVAVDCTSVTTAAYAM